MGAGSSRIDRFRTVPSDVSAARASKANSPDPFSARTSGGRLWKPSDWYVGFALRRFGQSFGSPAGVGQLPEDSQILFAIRLKCDSRSVLVPDRKAIASAERQLLQRGFPGEVVRPDVGAVGAVAGFDRHGKRVPLRRKAR